MHSGCMMQPACGSTVWSSTTTCQPKMCTAGPKKVRRAPRRADNPPTAVTAAASPCLSAPRAGSASTKAMTHLRAQGTGLAPIAALGARPVPELAAPAGERPRPRPEHLGLDLEEGGGQGPDPPRAGAE